MKPFYNMTPQNKELEGFFVQICQMYKLIFMLKHFESLSRYTVVIHSQITSRI